MTSEPRVLLVTGATSGIGRATAELGARAGDHLVLVARRDEVLDEVALVCDGLGAASTLTCVADVAEDVEVEKAVAKAVAVHGRVDAVVHAAGVAAYGRAEEVPAEVFEAVVRTNLIGSVNVVRHVLPLMRERDNGTLVLVGSVIGHIAVPSMTPYAVSKWGVRSLARQLQIENRDRRGVRIGYVVPGGVDTDIYDKAANYSGSPGRAPLPVSVGVVARACMRQLDRPRRSTQVGVANTALRLAFTLAPGLFDALVGPLFRAGATDQRTDVEANTGNVLR
ncbi:SDR family NAD(P)-dependent oxidoreductase [Solicola sp. PLA-1-18]|uniref:SDR family NAD(P)-dependent oxidoreductase n=1 Tax=Solicola sp. PLA-1-18 TaxID=3380532 RepID=UPI003B7AAF8E